MTCLVAHIFSAFNAACSLFAAVVGGPFETRTQDGRTALMCASESGQTDCVRLLLDAGADMNAKDKVRVFLMFRDTIMQNSLCLVLENDIDSPSEV
jgi:hypothetical protein